MLTVEELSALHTLASFANQAHQIVGFGPQAEADWAEMALHIHSLQAMLMSQSAARTYPDEFRLLGAVEHEHARATHYAEHRCESHWTDAGEDWRCELPKGHDGVHRGRIGPL